MTFRGDLPVTAPTPSNSPSHAPIFPCKTRNPWRGLAAWIALGLLAGPSLAQTDGAPREISEATVSPAVAAQETTEGAAIDEGILETQSLGAELAQLSERLDDRLRRVASLRSTDAIPEMVEEADRIERLLGFLGARAAALDPIAARRLTAKIDALRRQLGNLRRALTGVPLPSSFAARPETTGAILGWPEEGGGAPTNDVCVDAPTIGTGSFTGTTLGATQDGQATCGASLASGDVWFELIVPSSANVWIDTLGSDYDTVLSVHEGCPGTFSNQLACNDDALGLDSALGFFAAGGQSYWIRVSGYDGATGHFVLNIGLGGGIQGTVVDADSGLPVVDGLVCLYDAGGFLGLCAGLETSGAYLISENEPGTYFLLADGQQHIDELFDDIRCPQGFGEPGCGASNGTPLEVGSSGDTIADFALDLGGVIEGLLIDETTGQPLPSSTVWLWDTANQDTRQTWTGASGVFRFDGLTTGSYHVYTSTPSHQDEVWDDIPCIPEPFGPECDPTTGFPIAVTEGAIVSGIDFRLVRRGEITGQVTDARDGQPISGTTVRLHHLESGHQSVAFSDSSGNFSRSDLLQGTYFAWAERAGYSAQLFDGLPCDDCDVTLGTPIPLALDSTVGGIDFALEVQGSLGGRVTRNSDGADAPAGWVELHDSDGLVATDFFFPGSPYFFDQLEPGTYFAIATSSGFEDELYFDLPCEDGCDPAMGTPVAVTGGLTTTVDFGVDTGGLFSGTVTDAETGLLVDDVSVRLWNSSGGLVLGICSDGTFSIGPLDVGTYYLTASAMGYRTQIYQGLDCSSHGCDPTTGTPLISTLNSIQDDVDFHLDRGSGLTGTATSASDGSPIDNLSISVWNAEGQFVGSDRTDSSGSYALQGLTAGTYRVMGGGVSGFLSQMYDGIDCPSGCDLDLATPLVIPDDTILDGIDFALTRKGRISGTVLQADGQPDDFATLRAYRVQDLVLGGSGYAESDGTYVIEGLDVGDYLVHAESYQLANELYDNLPCRAFFLCDRTAATPVGVSIGQETPGIDFVLEELGGLSGVVRSDTGLAISGVWVTTWQGGDSSGAAITDATGFYVLDHLAPGGHYVTTSNSWGYLDESYDDIPCFGGGNSGCDPFKGTSVMVQPGLETRHVDFELRVFDRGVLGTVIDESEEPVPGVVVDLWSELGDLVASGPTDLNGTYLLAVPEGTYFVSTDNGQGLIDEVFDDLSCPGSAYAGGCDPTTGTPVVVGETGSDGAVASGIDFELRAPEPAFFADGFESGDLSAWSLAVGTLR